MKKIFDLEDYIKEIQKTIMDWGVENYTIHPWYRGHADCEWSLIPGIYRDSIKKYERELMRDFKLNCSKFLNSIPSNDFEWLFIMQHHSLPTRLLDWTESHLIALYFATIDYSLNCDSCVWIFHPWYLNSIVLQERTVPITSHPKLQDYLLGSSTKLGNLSTLYVDESRNIKAQYPVAIRSIRNTQRIIAQKGAFTIHGKESDCLESILKNIGKDWAHKNLKKVIIDKSAKVKILKQLFYAGITHSVIFPEMDGISRELKIRYSSSFLQH